MHHFIFPKQDSWISSGSSKIDGTSFRNQNFGQDEILEIKKEFFNLTFDYQTRTLVQFSGTEFTDMSQSIVNGDIVSPRFYLRLYEAMGNRELSTEYTLKAYPLSQSWNEGRGKFDDNPKVTDGVSWENREHPDGGTAVTWSAHDGNQRHGGYYISGSEYEASQSFSYQSPDIEMDVTDITNKWLGKTIPNNGLLLRFSGSTETDSGSYGHLKFFSSNTNTIYAPKLEVRWDDHKPCTGSNTGSLLQITSSGLADNYLYMIGLRDSYKENEKIKFRVGARKRYIQKTHTTSFQTLTGSFIPESSGSYSIIDISTGETVVPFSGYTSMSCDEKSNYFIQWLNGFYPDRVYKIIYKLKYDDSQEYIFDNNFEFTVKR